MTPNKFTWASLYFAVAASVFVYLGVRAFYVTPLHDEMGSFFIYLRTGDFLPWNAFFDANNHLLNSALGSFFCQVFGDHIFVLRLASLLFFPVFAFYIYRLGSVFFRGGSLFFFACSFLFLHNFIEYFGYSRGYGMGLACCIALLYYLCVYIKARKTKDLIWFSVFVFLSLLANLNLLLPALIAVGYLMVHLVCYNRKRIPLFVLWNFSWLGLAIWYGMALQKAGALYYGGKTGLVADTMTSLSTLLFDSKNNLLVYVLILPAIVSLLVLPLIVRAKKIKTFFTEPVWALLLLFWGPVIGICMMHLVLGTNYPEDRTALHLGILLLLVFFVSMAESGLKERITFFVPLVSCLLLLGLFVFKANFKYSAFWKNEYIPYAFFERTRQHVNPLDTYVSGYRLHEMIWTYYNYRSRPTGNIIHFVDYPRQQSDYIITGDSVYKDVLREKYRIADSDPATGVLLLERKKHIRLVPLDTIFIPDRKACTDMYLNLADYRDSSFSDKNICFEFSGRMETGDKTAPEFLMQIAKRGEKGGEETMRVNPNWMQKDNGGYTLQQRFYCPNRLNEARSLILFIYNPQQIPYDLAGIKTVVYEIIY